MSSPYFPDIKCAVDQQKVVSILAYMCTKLRVYSSPFLFLSRPNFTDLICSVYTKNPAIKKWLPFKLICAVYIVTSNRLLWSITWFKVELAEDLNEPRFMYHLHLLTQSNYITTKRIYIEVYQTTLKPLRNQYFFENISLPWLFTTSSWNK